MHKKPFDTSHELVLSHFQSGIQLKTYREVDDSKTAYTVKDILNLPCSVYFENYDGVLQNLNEHNANYCGFDSPQNGLQKPYFGSFSIKSRMLTRHYDQEVMMLEQIKIIEETILKMNDESFFQTLSIKVPWYDNTNKMIGLFGCSILLNQNPLAECLMAIAQLGLFTFDKINKFQSRRSSINLRGRELQCAQLLVQGKTTKEIAKQFGLSPRTIEHYIEKLKFKFKSKNKTALAIHLTHLFGQ